MSWWTEVKALFNSAQESSPTEPVLHEVLTRHRTHAEAFAEWRGGLVSRRLVDWLADQYARYLTDRRRVERSIDFLDTPSSKGFVIHFEDLQYSLREAEFTQLYLRQRVLSREYRTQIADTRTYSRGRHTERTDRYYLKPRTNFTAPNGPGAPMDGHTADQFDQQFGNVLIELVVRDERPHHLRFSAPVYHDRIYRKADSFGMLMDVVLGAG